jgi:hemolysin activation/secretion protein
VLASIAYGPLPAHGNDSESWPAHVNVAAADTDGATADDGTAGSVPNGEGSAPAAPAAAAAPLRFDIDEFRVDGAETMPQVDIESAVYPFLGPQRTVDDVEKARAALEKAYHDKGFQTVSVSVPAQNTERGTVVMTVTEGKVGVLRVKNSRYFDVDNIKKKAPSLKPGTLPNFGDVTQDIIALNQLPDRRVTPSLRAGVTPGTVDVDLTVEDKLPFHASAGFNNRQSPNTTPIRFNAEVRYDNLWQLGHSLSFTYQAAPERTEDAEAVSGSYLARLTDWSSILVYGVDSNSNVTAIGGLNVIGPGQVLGTRAILTLPALEGFFHTLSLGFDYKHFGQIVELDQASFSSPITYYPVVGSYSASWQGEKNLTQANVGATFNVRGFGSGYEEFEAKRYYSASNFFHANADITHTRDLDNGIQLYAKLAGQLADGALISSEQFSVGGADTVRGYLESEVIGDYGIVGTLEARGPNIADIIPTELIGEGGEKGPKLFTDVRLFAFFDGGLAAIHKPLEEQQSSFGLWSYGAGARFTLFDHVEGAVTFALPMIGQDDTRANEPRVLFNVSGSF